MNKCSISIRTFADYTKQLLAQDAKYKDFAEVAKFIIKRPGQPDAVKMVALKGLAKIYDQLAKKDKTVSFSDDDAKILDIDLEKHDLETQFKNISSAYSVRPAPTPTVSSVKKTISKLSSVKHIDAEDLIKQVISEIIALSRTNFMKSVDAMKSAITNLYDEAIREFNDNTDITPMSHSSFSKMLRTERDRNIDKNSQYVPIKGTTYGDTKLIIRPNGETIEVLQKPNGVFIDINSPDGLTQVSYDSTKDRLVNVRVDFSPFAAGNTGTQYLFSSSEISSGMSLRDTTKGELTGQLLPHQNPLSVLEVVASRKEIAQNKLRLQRIREEIPARTLETHEITSQQNALKAGNPILTVYSLIDGAQIKFRIPGQAGHMTLYGVDNYAIVYPDNTTERVDFSESQKALILKIGLKSIKTENGTNLQVPITEEDFYTLKARYEQFKAFKNAVQELLDQNKDADEVVIPNTLVQTYISLARSGEKIVYADRDNQPPLTKLLKKEGAPGQITLQVVDALDDDTYSAPQTVSKPIITTNQNGTWSLVTDLKKNQFVVVSKDGKTEYMRFADYVTEVLKIYPEINNPAFKYNFAWLYVKPNGRVQPIALRYNTSIASPLETAKMGIAFGEIIKTMSNPQTQNNIHLFEFNKDRYTFYPHNPKDGTSYAGDFDVFKDPSDQYSISIQLRPMDRKWSSVPRDVRKALTVYIDVPVMKAFLDIIREAAKSDKFTKQKLDVSSAEGQDALAKMIDEDPQLSKKLMSAWDNINSHVFQKFQQVSNKLEKTSFNGEFTLPQIYSIMENESKDLRGKWIMKVRKSKEGASGLSDMANYQSVSTEDIFEASSIAPVFTGGARAAVKPAAINTSSTQNTDANPVTDNPNALDIDLGFEDSSFSLAFDAELFQAYKAGQFQQELDWIKNNLPKEISVDDLADVLDELKAEGRVLGYFRDRVIYLNEQLSSRGTGYHEAFHGVFRKLMDQPTRARYLQLAKDKIGTITIEQVREFRQRRSLFHLSDAQIKDRIAEEYLADRFKSYKLEGRGAQEGWLKKLLNLIDTLIRFFNKNYKEIDGLFQRIDTGFYKNADIVGDYKEGALAMLPTRSSLVIGSNGKAVQQANFLNKIEQAQLVNRLAELIDSTVGIDFNEMFEAARKELIKELDINGLIAQNPSLEKEIRAKYESIYLDKLYSLGVPVSMINDTGNPAMDQNLSLIQSNPAQLALYNQKQASTLAELKMQVKQKLDKVSISRFYFDPEAMLSQEEDDFDEDDYGDRTDFEDNFVNLNTLDGLSRQFRSFFGLISYLHKDELGIETIRMVDGSTVFDAMMKILADTPVDLMVSRMEASLEKMAEDDDTVSYERLNAVWQKMKDYFGLNEDNQPTRNINLYNQFIDTFNVADLSTDVYYINSKNDSSTFQVFEATSQGDTSQLYEKMRRGYENSFMKKPVEERKRLLDAAKKVFSDVITSNKDNTLETDKSVVLKDLSKRVHKALKSIGINVPLHAVSYSLIAIDVIKNEKQLSPRSKAYKQYLIDQSLINSGAYLTKDFFEKINLNVDENTNIFDKTLDKDLESDNVGLTDQERVKERSKKKGIGLINKVLKKTAKYIIKYDMNTVVPVFRNAEGKNVYRYVRMTPPLLISQSLRENGWQKTYQDFPVVARFLQDNAFTKKNPLNELYLSNLELRVFGGARQTLKGVENDGVTAKTIDTAGYYLSYILMSMNRKTITDGKNKITTFNRMLTQNEASSTIYTIPNIHRQMVNKDGYISEDGENIVVKGFIDLIEQEYLRIQREWVSRNDSSKQKFINYNAKYNPDQSLNVEDPSLRAYNFNLLADFFDFSNKASVSKVPLRAEMRDNLIQKAKDGAKFSSLDLASLKAELIKYADEKFQVHLTNLKSYNIVQEDEETGELSSKLIPDSYKINWIAEGVNTDSTDLKSYLKDVYFNVFINNLQVSQFFDGDIALGVKNFADYFKRQKMNVAAGPAMKTGNHTVAYVNNISVLINKNDVSQGQYDDFDEMPNGFKETAEKVDVFDGQSITTVEHRIEQHRADGRLNKDVESMMSVEEVLKKMRYRRLTEEEVKFLQDNKIVLGPKKTVTGALIHYHKQAEHMLLRPESSYLVIPEGMTQQSVENKLAELHNMADMIRQKLRNADTYSISNDGTVDFFQDQLRILYTQIHRYWAPLPHREAHHYMLNSMELSDIDQLMDLNSSKKATLLPVKINERGITDLSQSRLIVPNKYKFNQVETASVSENIGNTTQLLHLIDTDINLDSSAVDSSLKDAVIQYRKLIGRLGEVSLNRLNNIIKDQDGNLDIRSIIKNMHDMLEKQGADSNTLKFFELRDDRPVHNVNLPLIKKMFTYHYFSFYSNNVFSRRQSGRKDYLVTSWGYKVVEDRSTGKIIKSEEIAKDPEKYRDNSRFKIRYPGIKFDKENNRYIVEIIVPRPFFKNQEEVELFERKLSTWLSTRIPTEDKRSMIVAQVVDFVDGAYLNTIIVPQLIHILSGSDLDIDSLYSHTFATYKDFNGKTKVYGEANTPKEMFAEYIQSMMEDETLAPLIKLELDKIYKEKITEVPDSLKDLADDLNLPYRNYTKEKWVAAIEELRNQRNQMFEEIQTVKEKRKKTQEIYEKLKSENEAMVQRITENLKSFLKSQGMEVSDSQFADLLWEETAVMKNSFRQQGDLRASLEAMNNRVKNNYDMMKIAGNQIRNSASELEKISRLMKLLATLNVLANKKLPTNAVAYSKEASRKESLVTEVLQNDLLQAKIDILGSKYVFDNLFIKESSNVKRFEEIASSLNKSVKDVVNKNNIFSPDGIIGSRDMVTSSNAGIGIAANINKFAAFASKNKLKLKAPIWSVNNKDFTDFESDSTSRPVGDIGNILGMQADAKSNPIPAVLNLNEVSLPITLVMITQKLPLEMCILINSVPVIADVLQNVMLEKRKIRTISDLYTSKSLRSIGNANIYKMIDLLKQKEIHSQIFEVDEAGNIEYNLAGDPILRSDLELSFKYDKTPNTRSNANELGFTMQNKSGLVEDLAVQTYLLIKYLETSKLNNDVFAVGSILNLYKKLKPSWKSVDRALYNYAYLTGGIIGQESKFLNIGDILENSKEFQPLVKALNELSINAESILIERNPVMKAIDDTVKGGLQSYVLRDESVDTRLSNQITKFFIVNKFREETEKELAEEKAKSEPNQLLVKSLTNALAMFKADFWKGTIEEQDVTLLTDDLEYLKDNHDGNPFVDYLKERTRQGINFIEALSRMRLEKENTESIIDGFMMLQLSPDIRSKLIARKFFHYLLVKDGLDYGTNTFIQYLNPSDSQTFEKVSSNLNDLQKSLIEFNNTNRIQFKKGKPETYFNRFTTLLNSYFNKKVDLNVYISSLINRIGLYAGNNDIMVKSKPVNYKSKLGRFNGIDVNVIREEMKNLLPDTGSISPKDIYTEIEEDPDRIDLWVPTSKEPGEGKLVIDTSARYSPVSSLIISQMSIQESFSKRLDSSEEKKYQFPLFVKNTFGQVLRLVEVDDTRISDKILNNLAAKLSGKPYSTSINGVKAKYLVAEQEGTPNILSLGFNEKEAKELYKFSKEDNDNAYMRVEISDDFDKIIQKLRDVYKVDIKRINALVKNVKRDAYTLGSISFDSLKNKLFSIDFTVDTEDRGPVRRIMYFRPNESNPFSLKLEIREREVVSGAERLLVLPDNLSEFNAIDVEFVKRGKAFARAKEKGVTQTTKEMVDQLIKNYVLPEGRVPKSGKTFEKYITDRFNYEKERLDISNVYQLYNSLFTVPEVTTPPIVSVATPVIEPGRYVKFNNQDFIVTKINDNGTVQIYDPTKEGVDSKKSVAARNLIPTQNKALIIKYRNIDYLVTPKNTIISLLTNKAMKWLENSGERKDIIKLADELRKPSGSIDDVRNELDSGECIAEI